MPSNWIPYKGDGMPVDGRVIVEIDHNINRDRRMAYDWHWDTYYSVVQYRIIECNTWLPHTIHGTVPVNSGDPVKVRFRRGTEAIAWSPASDYSWDTNELPYDIVEYMVRPADEFAFTTDSRVITLKEVMNITKDWKSRETRRFIDNEFLTKEPMYKHLPDEVIDMLKWYNFTIKEDHFIHIGRFDKSKIGYTRNDKDGERDKQTVTKIGKYLKQFSKLKDNEIANVSNLYRMLVIGNVDLKFARTREEIKEVYLKGPNSCMSHPTSEYATSGIHPVEVYATPDISVAYLSRKDADGVRITARVVCNEIQKEYTRIYGDEQTLRPLIEELGYTKGDLEGCSLLLLRNKHNGIICPYLDGIQDVGEEDEMLTIGGDDYEASNTNGLLSRSGISCDHCGEIVDECYLHYSEYHEMSICTGCAEDSDWVYAYTIEGYQDWINSDHVSVFEYNNEYYMDDALEHYDLIYCEYNEEVISSIDAIWCERDGTYAHTDNTSYYKDRDGDEYYTIETDDIVITEDSGEPMLIDDCYCVDGEYFEDEPEEEVIHETA